MENPKVSVIIPVYKVEKYLDRCIESVVRQTYKNLEIILVDDGSPDNCPQMCDEWAKKDNRIKIIHKKNGGQADARNQGMKISTGEYICFVDSDDYIDRAEIEKGIKNALKNNSDVVIFSFNIDNGNSITPIHFNLEKKYFNNETIKEKLLSVFYTNKDQGLFGPCNKLYKSEFLKNNNLHFEINDIRCEDYWFNFRVFHYADVVTFFDECLYFYFQNLESTMHNIDNINYNKWVENKRRLLDDGFCKKITVDYDSFYCQFQMNVIVYLKDLLNLNRVDDYNIIVKDDFLNNATRYRKLLPKKFKIFSYMINKKMYRCFKLALLIWNTIKG